MKPLKSQNYYEILGVSRYATQEEIRNAFELARHTFKDNSLATYSLFSDEENTEILKLITEAYQTLFNPELRRQYDGQLSAEEKRAALGARAVAGERPAMRPAAVLPRAAAPPPAAPAARAQRPASRNAAEGGDAAPERAPAMAAPSAAERIDARAVAAYADTVERFSGEALRQIRIKAGIELDDLAERTKIRRTYLQYLEEENFEFLPAPVYIKGFITIIARTLSLPPERVARDYMQKIPGYGLK